MPPELFCSNRARARPVAAGRPIRKPSTLWFRKKKKMEKKNRKNSLLTQLFPIQSSSMRVLVVWRHRMSPWVAFEVGLAVALFPPSLPSFPPPPSFLYFQLSRNRTRRSPCAAEYVCTRMAGTFSGLAAVVFVSPRRWKLRDVSKESLTGFDGVPPPSPTGVGLPSR